MNNSDTMEFIKKDSDTTDPYLYRKASIEPLFDTDKSFDTSTNVTEKITDIAAMRKALTRVKQTIESSRTPQSSRRTVPSPIVPSSYNAHHAAKLRIAHVYELSQTQPVIDTTTQPRTYIHHAKSVSDPSTVHRIDRGISTPIHPSTVEPPRPRLRPRAISTGNNALVCNTVDMIAPHTSNTSSAASTPIRCTPPQLNRFLSHHIISSTNTSTTTSPSRSLRTLKERIKSRNNTPKIDSDEPFSPLSAPITIRTRHNSVTEKALTPVLTSLRSPIVTITPTHQFNTRRHTVPPMRLNNSVNTNSEHYTHTRTALAIHTPISISTSCRSSSEIVCHSNTVTPHHMKLPHHQCTYHSTGVSPHGIQRETVTLSAYSTASTPNISVYPTPKHIEELILPVEQLESELITESNVSRLQIDTIASLIHDEPVHQYLSPIHHNPFGLKLQVGNEESAPHSFVQNSIQSIDDNQSIQDHTNMHTTESRRPERGNLRRSSTTGVSTTHRTRVSYDITNSGALKLGDGYEIGKNGIVNVPYATTTVSSQLNTPASMSSTASTSEHNNVHGDTTTSAPTYADTHQSPHNDIELPMRSCSEHTSLHSLMVPTVALPSPPRFTSAPCSTGSRKRQPALGVSIKLSDLVKLGELGRGATGPVYKALYLPTLQVVALKTVRIDHVNERHQMVKELQTFHTLHNPNILSFIGASFNDGKLTMVLEYMNCGSLDQVVKRCGALSEDVIRNIAEQTLLGLQHLHDRHKIHRDIKPANILVNTAGKCKISDFGLVKQLDNTNAMCNTFVGTLMYLSPERVTGDDFSYPSDIWSLGLSLIYCAQQALPVPKDYWALVTMFKQQSIDNDTNTSTKSPFELDGDVFSREFCDFVRCCMQKDPLKRSTATQLLQHAFIRSPDGTSRCSQMNSHANTVDANLNEINKLVDAVMHHCYAKCAEWKYDQQDVVRVKHLAEQLGCMESMVENAFRNKFEVQSACSEKQVVQTLDGMDLNESTSSLDDDIE